MTQVQFEQGAEFLLVCGVVWAFYRVLERIAHFLELIYEEIRTGGKEVSK